MLTMCGAMISELSLSSLQLMPSSPVAFVAEIFRSWLRTNSVVIFGNLKYAHLIHQVCQFYDADFNTIRLCDDTWEW